MICGIHHVSMVVSNTDQSRNFYREVLGLEETERNPLIPFPGAWFAVGNLHIHLLEVTNQDPTERVGPGVEDRHIALTVESIPEFMDRLRDHNWPFVFRDKANAVFIRDPDGNAIEFVQKD